MKKYLFYSISLLAGLLLSFKSEKNSPLWLRYPAISPDGKTIVFCYKGDIYKIGTEGGTAMPLTLSAKKLRTHNQKQTTKKTNINYGK